MPIKATDLKRGNALIWEGQLHVVIGTEHTKPGKGPAYVQAKMKNVATGTIKVNRINSSDKVEDVSIDKRKIDDPVGAVSVHGVCGAWGTLAIGIFGSRAVDILYWDEATAIQDGLLYGGGIHQLWVQFVGVISVFAYTFICAAILFLAIKYTIGLRVSAQEEIEGLDLGEHDMSAYPDFQQTYIKSYHAREL